MHQKPFVGRLLPGPDGAADSTNYSQLVTWSTRHMVNSSHGQLVTWSTRHMVNSSHGQLVTQSTRHTVENEETKIS